MKKVIDIVRISVWLFVIFIIAQGPNCIAQDSASNAVQDDLLEQKESQTEKIIFHADSVKRADSLERVSLEKEIQELNTKDLKRKEALRNRLDSLKTVQAIKADKVKRQVGLIKIINPWCACNSI